MSSPASQPSRMYYFTFGMGCTGIAFTGSALWSDWQLSAGRNPIDGFGNASALALAICFAIMYCVRLITWDRVSVQTQQRVQQGIVLILTVAFFLAAVSLAVSFFVNGRNDFLAKIYGVLACLCQIGTAFWLFKYQRETAKS